MTGAASLVTETGDGQRSTVRTWVRLKSLGFSKSEKTDGL